MKHMTYNYGLIGRDISYSLSPKIHNYSGLKLNRDIKYGLFDIASEELFEDFLNKFYEIGGMGLNITTPYKSYVAKLLNADLSSVNTLTRGGDSWQASSTDGAGFEAATLRMGRPLFAYPGLIFIGNGGAVASIVEHIELHYKDSYRPKIIMFRRNERKDQFFQKLCSQKIDFFDFDSKIFRTVLNQKKNKNYLLVQGTSAPQYGYTFSAWLPALAGFSGGVMDLVYGNHSLFLEEAKKNKIPSSDGLAMLIEQARLSQSAWWGESLEFKKIIDHLQLTKPLEG